ncbi:MAG: hypothetical protein RL593_29, partial [Pseudomonadota bacterium]
AVRKKQLPTAELLIKNGADVNHKDGQGLPLLHNAVNNGDTEMVRLLLKSGADPKVKDQYSLTALVYAMQAKRSDIVTLLKDAGGNY